MSVIKVEKRNEALKARQLRQKNLVPCCVYGGTLPQSVSIQMDRQDATQLFRTKREGSKVTLDFNGLLIQTQIKEKKRNVLNNEVEHFSFEALAEGQKVNSVAHIFLRNADVVPGILEQILFEVPFSSLPEDMIDTVTIDLEGIPAGTNLTLQNIPEFRHEGITLQIPKNTMVLRIRERKRALAPHAG